MSEIIEYESHLPFTPELWQVGVLRDTSPVLLLTGSAGGGKSKVALEKCHALCLYYPGVMVVAARKTREDAEKSIVQVLEEDVIGSDPRVRHIRKRYIFQYENGSKLMYVGMKDKRMRKAIRSVGHRGGIDFAFFEEATEFDEEDFDEMNMRLRGKAMGWTQFLLATNPDAPLHWINVRLIMNNEAKVIYSSAADNPHNPDDYKKRLDTTRGVLRARLRDGLWIAGTGLVIDTWLDDWDEWEQRYSVGNVRPEAEYIEDGGPVILAADDGYAGEMDKKTGTFTRKSNPRVFLLCQYRSDGQIAVFYEDYRVKTQTEDHLAALRDACRDNGWPFPKTADYDKSAAHLEGRFKDFAFTRLRKSPASREESIKLLREACDADANGWRNVIVHPRCFHLRNEFSSWSLDNEGNPEPFGDHGPDALRYHVWNMIRGPGRPVEVAATHMTDELKEKLSRVEDIVKRRMAAAKARIPT